MTAHHVACLTVPARIEAVREAASFMLEQARAHAAPVAANPLFEVAVVEALNNAVQHNAAGDGNLRCELEVDGRRLLVRVLDERVNEPAPLSLPSTGHPPELSTDGWQSIPDSGYGLYLIRAVFPEARPVTREGVHGIELELSY